MKLTKEEKLLLDDHIEEQRKIRKIDKEWETLPDFEQRLDIIVEQSYWAMCDFIINKNLHNNKEKLKLCWEYFKKNL